MSNVFDELNEELNLGLDLSVNNVLDCKNCETPTECEEGVSAITCSLCCATMGVNCN